MRKSFAVAMVAAASWISGVASGQVARPPAAGGFPAAPTAAAASPAAPSGVAVVDVNYIFKEHLRFQQMKEDLRRQVEGAQADIKRRAEEIKQTHERLQGLNLRPDSPEYKQEEAKITVLQAQLQADMQVQKKDFVQREARMYFNVYQEITTEVNRFAQGRYSLVLQFNGEPIDFSKADPSQVLRDLNRPVVYYDRSVDITPYVLKSLNRSAIPPAGGNAVRPGVPGPTR